MFRLVTICIIIHATIGALATDSSEAWEFRLSEGISWLVSGRAMFRTNSTEEWGYVCSDEFKENDYGPLAFCHSLGLLGITQARFIPAPRTFLDRPILLDDVKCLENATFMQNCTHNPIGVHNCLDGGNELSGVECTIPPEYWEFRLVGGIGAEIVGNATGNATNSTDNTTQYATPTNGRVEMRPLPSLPWGSINNALFKRGSGYDTAALKAVCTTLGFNVTGIVPVAIDVSYYSPGPAYLQPQYCYEGSDPYLQNCTIYTLASTTWPASSQLAVECNPTWEFQLVNDVTSNPWEGRVIGRISKAMSYSRVCSNVLYTDALYSLCRSSGITDAYYARKMPLGTYGLDPTIESESPYILSSLECSDPFSEVEKCEFSPLFSLNCGANGQLNLRCPPFNASEWQFRLRNTTSVATRGYFEINPYESIGEPWMYLTHCISASLACQQAGFSNWSYPPSVTYASPESGMGSVGFMMSPTCSGNTFDTCRLNKGYYLRSYRYAGCYYYAAYLDCNTTKPPDPYVDFPALWQFRMVTNAPEYNGSVLVNDTYRVNGTWTESYITRETIRDGVCDEDWFELDTNCSGTLSPGKILLTVYSSAGDWVGGVTTTTSIVDGVCLNGTWTSGNCTGTWNESETFYSCNGTANGSDCINGTWEVSSVVNQSTVPGVCVNGSWVEGACANNGTWVSFELVGRTCARDASTGTNNKCNIKEVDFHIIQNTTVLGPEYVAPQYVNGTALVKPRNGRVEMRMTAKDPWLRISDSSSATARRAVCRVLNFTDVEYVPNISPTKYGVGEGNFSLTGVWCNYWSRNTDVRYCSHDMPPQTVCASCNDMTVECEPYAPQYRLYGGTRESNGRFQMKPSNSSAWTGVCSYNFFQNDADAACHQLGYHTAEKSFEYRDWTLGSFSNILSDPICDGVYAYENCSLQYALGDYPSCYTDVGLECDPLVLNTSLFEYRLVNGTTSREGRVEMRFNSSYDWERVCYPTSYVYDARISACWSVGIMDTRWAPGVSATAYGPGNDTVLWAQTSLYCYGKSYLNQCSFDKPVYTYGCSTGDFAVTCPTFEPDFRLVTFERKDAGRLEFRPHPSAPWGNVYNGIFSKDEIAVACRHFGFNESLDVQQTFTFPAPTQTTYLYSLNCHPNGTSLIHNCTYPSRMSDSVYYWTSQASLGLDCNPKKWRLNPSTGTTPGAGRIEYRPTVLSAWGTVCNDGFKTSHTAWLAACRSVGWTNVTSAKPVYYGAGTGTIYIDDISCPIGAMYLEQCSHSPVGDSNCAHVEDSGVDCFAPVDVPDAWQFRLSGGTAGSNGRLEVKPDATSPWGTICQDTFNYSYTTWLTACQTVGYPTSRAEFKRYPNLGSPVFLDHIDCKPNSTHLSNCSMFPLGSFGCAQSDMAGIDCNPQVILPDSWEFRLLPMIPHENATIVVPINCSNASFTNNVTGCTCATVFVGGESKVVCAAQTPKTKVFTATYRKGVQVGGLLQFRPKPTNEWGFVCNGSKTVTQSFVEAACRSVGLEPSFALLSHDYGFGFGYNYLSDPECSGTDMYLQNCSFAQLYVNDCDHTTDIAIECVLPTPSGTITKSGTVTISEELPITDSVSISVSLTDTLRLYMGRPPSSALASFPPLLAGPVMALLAVVGTPIEVQIFIVLLLGPCASVGDHDSAYLMSFFLSPFIALGDAVAVIGNVVLGLLFFTGHLLLAVVAHRLQGRLWNKQPVAKCDTAIKYVQDKDTSVDSLQKGGGVTTHYTYREVLALSCFPGIPLFACRVLLTGVALFGNLSLMRGMGAPATNAEEEELDGMTDRYLMLSAGVIGILFQVGVVSAFAVSLWAARREQVYENGSVSLPNVTYVSYIWSQTRVPGWLQWICPRGRWISTPAPRLDDSISSVVEPPFPYAHRTITGVATASHGRYFYSGMIPVVVAVVLGGIPFGFLHTAWTDGYIEEKNPYIIRDPTITSTTTTVAYCGYLYLLPAVGMIVIGALYGGMRLSRSIVQSVLTAACYVVVGGFAIAQGILRIDEGLATEEIGRVKSILGYVLMFLVIVRLVHTVIVFLIEHCTTAHTALVHEEDDSTPSHGPSGSTTESALDEVSEEEPAAETPEDFADIKHVNTPCSDKLMPASSPNDQPLVSVIEEDGIVILDIDSLANSRSYTRHPSRRPSLLSAGANRTISGGFVFRNGSGNSFVRTLSRQSGTAGRTLTPGNTVHRVATPSDWGARIDSDINNIAPAQRDPPTVARVWAQLQSAVREGHVAALSEPSLPAPNISNDVVVDDYSDEEPNRSPTLQVSPQQTTQGWAALKKKVLPKGKQQDQNKKWKI